MFFIMTLLLTLGLGLLHMVKDTTKSQLSSAELVKVVEGFFAQSPIKKYDWKSVQRN